MTDKEFEFDDDLLTMMQRWETESVPPAARHPAEPQQPQAFEEYPAEYTYPDTTCAPSYSQLYQPEPAQPETQAYFDEYPSEYIYPDANAFSTEPAYPNVYPAQPLYTETYSAAEAASQEQYQSGYPDAAYRNPWGGSYSRLEAAASRVWREEEESPAQAMDKPAYSMDETSYHAQRGNLQHSDLQRVKQMKKKRKREIRRRHPMRKILMALLALVLAGAGLCYTTAFVMADKMNQEPLAQGDSAVISAIAGSGWVTNILLMGLDSESEGVRSGGEGDGRADSMLLLSIDRKHGKLKFTSFLRDSWLPLPNGNGSKLNAASRQGGAGTLMQTIGNNFNLRIDHYVQVDFKGFKVLIDALGGISVPVTNEEADFLCNTTRLGKQIGRESMRQQMTEKGNVEMTGEQALIYCRIRKLDDDFHRAQRQRKVMSLIAEKCRKNPLRLAAAAGKVLPYIQTDMSQGNLAALATGAPLYVFYGAEEHQVPSQGTWYYDRRDGASVIIMDVSNNASQLNDFIYE